MSEHTDDRRIYFNEITWPNGQVELHPVGGGEPIVTREPFVRIEPPAAPGALLPRQDSSAVNARRRAMIERYLDRSALFAPAEDEEPIRVRYIDPIEFFPAPEVRATDPADNHLADAVNWAWRHHDWSAYEGDGPFNSPGMRRQVERARDAGRTISGLEVENQHLRERLLEARQEIDRLRDELRAAHGWSTDNSPALGGPLSEN